MGGKPRVKLEFDPWGKMKPEGYSCHVPWDTKWKQIEASLEAEFGGKHTVLPMPGVILPEPDTFRPGRDLWRLLGHYSGCGHWTEHPEGGELCGVYMTREAAEGALVAAAKGACWDCLMKAWEPILSEHRKRESDEESTEC
jgi:hypothetical protein